MCSGGRVLLPEERLFSRSELDPWRDLRLLHAMPVNRSVSRIRIGTAAVLYTVS